MCVFATVWTVLRIFYFQKGIILEERMCDTSMLEEKAMVQFLNRFTDYPFLVKWKDHEDRVGHGNPMFAVDIRETIPVKKLMDSTSLALGEAYMKGKLEVEGSLYEALDHFLDVKSLDSEEDWNREEHKFCSVTSFTASKETVHWIRN